MIFQQERPTIAYMYKYVHEFIKSLVYHQIMMFLLRQKSYTIFLTILIPHDAILHYGSILNCSLDRTQSIITCV